MKKKTLIYVILGFVLVAAAVLTVLLLSKNSKPQMIHPTNALEFNDEADLHWVEFGQEGENLGSINQELLLSDGQLHLNKETAVNTVNLKTKLVPGMIIHSRIRTGENGLRAFIFFDDGKDNVRVFRISGERYGNITAEAMFNQSGNTTEAALPLYGLVTFAPDEWVDLVFGLSEQGDRLLYAIGNSEDGREFAFGAIGLSEDWKTHAWTYNCGGWAFSKDNEKIDVDFINIATGNIEDYLYYYVPSYVKAIDQEQVDFNTTTDIHDLEFLNQFN